MTRIRLKYVNGFANRTRKSGVVRYYFRRGRSPAVRLPGLPGSEEFMRAYQAALAASPSLQAPSDIGAERTVPGTLNAAIVAFYKSRRFAKNRPITQATDRGILEALREKHGDKRIAMLERRHIEALLSEKAATPSAQRNLLRVLRVLLDFAVTEKLCRSNPTAGIVLDPVRTTGFHSWTEAELRRFERRHPLGTKPRLALSLLLYTAQRRSDVVRLGPAMLVTRDGEQHLALVQSKTGTALEIPVAQPLAAVIAATPMVGVRTFLVTEYGKPFTAAGFGNWFRDRCNEAGLPHCSAHGLRKAFLRRMAEAGCSEDFIASISGHRDMREIRTYVAAANRTRMARQGMAKTLAAFPARTDAKEERQ